MQRTQLMHFHHRNVYVVFVGTRDGGQTHAQDSSGCSIALIWPKGLLRQRRGLRRHAALDYHPLCLS